MTPEEAAKMNFELEKAIEIKTKEMSYVEKLRVMLVTNFYMPVITVVKDSEHKLYFYDRLPSEEYYKRYFAKYEELQGKGIITGTIEELR
jgi:hypothetical protein